MTNTTDAVRSSTSWGKLTRGDLRGFDTDATKAVLFAMDHGGEARISGNGHAIIRAQNGLTMSISRSLNKSRQVVALELQRLFPDAEEEKPKLVVAKPRPPTKAKAAQSGGKFDCTAKTCDQTFTTQGGLYHHIHSAHAVCQEPGCNYASDRKASVAAHWRCVHGVGHGALHPRTVGKQRKLEAAAREAAAAVDAAATKPKKAAPQPADPTPVAPTLAEPTLAEPTRLVVTPTINTDVETLVNGSDLAHARESHVDPAAFATLRRVDEWVTQERAAAQTRIDELTRQLQVATDKLTRLRQTLDA